MIMRLFFELDQKFGWLLNAAALISSLALVGLMLFLVVARYIFGWSIIGLLELIMLFGMWLYMVGSLIASRKREHLVVDFLQTSLRDQQIRRLHQALISLITLVITGFFVYLSYRMLTWGMRRPQHTPGLSIPLWIPQSAIMFASIGCSLYALRDFIQCVIGHNPNPVIVAEENQQDTY
ncbi:TRAP transporter small permease [Amphritea sp. 1_MG-2023]|uniref:TRAP transporter small permease n=1 Tax=Amphritea sp. 1_MG-2023 TaxID=3062670 RepID=UPI0026E1D940|nr:TRAP transporter small permease [Amphritea sp. 1_MG-2023]MDO6564823.1 TRAP transporter small permease [Amphritea sp. 1_MG-2023]